MLFELRRAITNVAVPHNEPPAVVRRRRIVVGVTLVIGAAVLGLSLRASSRGSKLLLADPGAGGGVVRRRFTSGPAAPGRHLLAWRNQRPVISGTTIGLVLGGVFALGGLIAREIPSLAGLITRVLAFAHQGSIWPIVAITLINGVAEEVFFRGALYSALGRYHPAVISTILYTARHGQRQRHAWFSPRSSSGRCVRWSAGPAAACLPRR